MDRANTVSKRFVGGGRVGPFLQQASIGPIASLFAVLPGLAFHAAASYIAGLEAEDDAD